MLRRAYDTLLLLLVIPLAYIVSHCRPDAPALYCSVYAVVLWHAPVKHKWILDDGLEFLRCPPDAIPVLRVYYEDEAVCVIEVVPPAQAAATEGSARACGPRALVKGLRRRAAAGGKARLCPDCLACPLTREGGASPDRLRPTL